MIQRRFLLKKKKHKSHKNKQSSSNNNENKEKDGNLLKERSFKSVYPNNDGNGDVEEEDDAHDDMNDDEDEDDARGSSVDNETELEEEEEEEEDQTSSNCAGGIGDLENNLNETPSAISNTVRPTKDLKLPSLQTLDDLMYHDDLDEEKAYEDLCYVTFKSEVNNEILFYASMFCSVLMLTL